MARENLSPYKINGLDELCRSPEALGQTLTKIASVCQNLTKGALDRNTLRVTRGEGE